MRSLVNCSSTVTRWCTIGRWPVESSSTLCNSNMSKKLKAVKSQAVTTEDVIYIHSSFEPSSLPSSGFLSLRHENTLVVESMVVIRTEVSRRCVLNRVAITMRPTHSWLIWSFRHESGGFAVGPGVLLSWGRVAPWLRVYQILELDSAQVER